MKKLSNITVKELRAVLTLLELKYVDTTGGHEKWIKEGMKRPVVFQTHVEPVPEFIIRNALWDMGVTRKEFIAILEKL